MIKNCPLCGSEATSTIFVAHCSNTNCALNLVNVPVEEWNRRPAEEEMLKIIKQVKKVFDLGNCDGQEAFMEWLKESNELAKNVDETIKKYEVSK